MTAPRVVTAPRPARWAVLLAAVALAGLAVVVRLPALHQPLDRDLGAHAAVGAYLAHDGLIPYVDVVDNKQPLPYLLYAAIAAAAPHRTAAVRVAGMLVAAAAVALTVLLARRVLGTGRAALGTGLATVAGASRWVQGVDLNTEHLLVLTGAAAVLVPLRFPDRVWAPAISGLLLGLAALSKAPGALLAVPALIPLLARRPGRRVATLAWYAAGAALPPAVVVAVYAALGHLPALLRWNVTYNLRYVAEPVDLPWWRAVAPPAHLAPITVLVLAGLGVGIAHLARGRAGSVPAGTLLAWLAVAYVGAELGRRDFEHYYAPVVAPAALLTVLPAAPRLGRWSLAATAALATALALPFAVDLAGQVGRGPDELAIRLYRPTQAIPWTYHDEVGAWLRTRASPDDRVFVVGNEPGFYWSSGLEPATPYLLDMPRQVVPDFDREVAEALRRDPPRYLVFPYGDPVWHPYVAPLEGLPYRQVATFGPVHVLELRHG